jgi:hypothetical protein
MKKVLAFDIDQTLNIAKTPIPDEIAELLTKCLDHYEICPISGQKFDQFLIQIVDRLKDAAPEQLSHLHLFVAQGTQYYRYNIEKKIGSRFTITLSPTSKLKNFRSYRDRSQRKRFLGNRQSCRR